MAFDLPPDTLEAIHKEIRSIIQEQYARAKTIITDHREQLDLVATSLLEHETLTGEEVAAILRGDKVDEFRAAKSRARESLNQPPAAAKEKEEDEPDVDLSGAEGLAHS